MPHKTLSLIEGNEPNACLLLLIRHADRGHIPEGEVGNNVALLEEGIRRSAELGKSISARITSIHSSPIPRCLQTAESILQGAEINVPISHDRMLGDPGPYVENGEVAWESWQKLGLHGITSALIKNEKLPGMHSPRDATQRLVNHLRKCSGGRSGIHLFISHDAIIATAAAHCLGISTMTDQWPEFLEPLMLEYRGNETTAKYRQRYQLIQ